MTGRSDAIATTLHREVRLEAQRLLDWWSENLPDETNGGFYGEIGAAGRPVADAPKSIILNARLLWFFSAMATHLKSDPALGLAQRAAGYIGAHFIDPEKGGVYWMLDHTGKVIEAKKQAYAQAFAVYALAEYFQASGDSRALDAARSLQARIEQHFWEPQHGGYVEALSGDWGPVGDQRLSDKDADCPKTMNTHLHVLEAYTRLHEVAPDAQTRSALDRALGVFVDRFADRDSSHLHLFFDIDWHNQSHSVSFGHDVEASWLIHEAARVLGDATVLARVERLTLSLAQATLNEGLNADGGLSQERDFDGRIDPAGEWWCQAEAMVGFVNAWQLSGDDRYLEATLGVWHHLKSQFGAASGDEWRWYADNSGRAPMPMAGQWKCPYHNGRAMIELDRRLRKSEV